MRIIEKYALRLIFRRAVRQRPGHSANTRTIFEELRAAWKEEFTEDNMFTQDAHLTELFCESRPAAMRFRRELANSDHAQS